MIDVTCSTRRCRRTTHMQDTRDLNLCLCHKTTCECCDTDTCCLGHMARPPAQRLQIRLPNALLTHFMWRRAVVAGWARGSEARSDSRRNHGQSKVSATHNAKVHKNISLLCVGHRASELFLWTFQKYPLTFLMCSLGLR